MNESTPAGFLGTLFDLSFKELITPKVIKLLFVLGICVDGLMAVIILIAGLLQGGPGYVSVILAPLAFLVWVIALRVTLEIVMSIFKIAENTEILARRESG